MFLVRRERLAAGTKKKIVGSDPRHALLQPHRREKYSPAVSIALHYLV